MHSEETATKKPDDVQLFSRCNFCGAFLDEDGNCPREHEYLDDSQSFENGRIAGQDAVRPVARPDPKGKKCQ
jgi:hypothetical protein